MPELPAHASPAYTPVTSPRPIPVHSFSHLDLNDNHRSLSNLDYHDQRPLSSASTASADRDHDAYHSDDNEGAPPPPSIISPAFTPPSTPGTTTPLPHHMRPAKSISVDSSTNDSPAPKLVEELPVVNCVVRARIPTVAGQEMFLHLYTNNVDNKEHLAIVFGPYIRSKSLDKVRPGETEMDRMIRGAYTGRLYPGRTSSQLQVPSKGQGHAKVAHKALENDRPLSRSGGRTSRSSTLAKEEFASTDASAAQEHSHPDGSVDGDTEDAAENTIDIHDIPPLVRIHSECYTGETVWSARCDCGEQLDEAARLMSLGSPPTTSSPASSHRISLNSSSTATQPLEPGGVIVYLKQEGRGIGLSEKLKAYNLQDLGNDTVEANLLLRHPADARSYGLATAMLLDLGLGGDRGIRLLTNNPDKVRAVEGPNREVRVRERVAMVPVAWKTGGKEGFRSTEVDQYLRTKVSVLERKERS